MPAEKKVPKKPVASRHDDTGAMAGAFFATPGTAAAAGRIFGAAPDELAPGTDKEATEMAPEQKGFNEKAEPGAFKNPWRQATISEEQFCALLAAVEAQHDREAALVQALAPMLDTPGVAPAVGVLTAATLQVVGQALQDEHGLLAAWAFEADFGRESLGVSVNGEPLDLGPAAALYAFLCESAGLIGFALKACPFCGSPEIVVAPGTLHGLTHELDGSRYHQALCLGCGASGPKAHEADSREPYERPAAIIAALDWNRRAAAQSAPPGEPPTRPACPFCGSLETRPYRKREAGALVQAGDWGYRRVDCLDCDAATVWRCDSAAADFGYADAAAWAEADWRRRVEAEPTAEG